MNGRKKPFSTANECLSMSNDLDNICNLALDLNHINRLLEDYAPGFLNLCHCGAMDYANDTIVFYCNNNAAFHTVNNQVPYLRAYLENRGINFHKILVKVRPVNYNRLRKEKKKPLTDQQKNMLLKFADAINRRDLILDDSSSSADDDREIIL